MTLTVVGLGPGDADLLTRQAWEVLSNAGRVYVRTRRHPAVSLLPPDLNVISFDGHYERAETFDELYEAIVAELCQLAVRDDVVYAVPGHPMVGESTVSGLLLAARQQGTRVRIVAGLSFVEPLLTVLGLDALDGLQLFDAVLLSDYHYPPLNPDVPVLLGQVYSRDVAGRLKLSLMAIYPDDHRVTLVHAAGTDGEVVEELPLHALDQSRHIDHLSSLFVPPLPARSSLSSLAETVAVLRGPEGCPWDQEQTPLSMRPGFLEEATEVLLALESRSVADTREELGDLLYHLVMQAQMAAEGGDFKLVEVIAGIEAKLRRRHPHVWGDWEAANAAEVVDNWELIKRTEKGGTRESILDAIKLPLPALAASQKMQDHVGRVGFDWPAVEGVWEKLAEEIDELQHARDPGERHDELGDVLFTLVNLARWLGLDTEMALRDANARFGRRFRGVETLATARDLQLRELSLEQLNSLWEEAKHMLSSGATHPGGTASEPPPED